MKKTLLVLMTAFSQCAFSQDITTGLIAYYPFNNNANDASANALNGVLHGATFTSDKNGIANSAALLDGSSYIEVPNNAKLNPSNLSFSAWIKPEQGGFVYPLVSKGSIEDTVNVQYALALFPNDDFILDTIYNGVKTQGCNYYYDETINEIDARYVFAYGDWHHVTLTYDNGAQKLYIDGNLVSQNPGATHSPILSCTGSLNIGASVTLVAVGTGTEGDIYAPESAFFAGTMDEVRLYNRALSAQDIKALYDNVTGLNKTYYKELGKLIYPNPSVDGKVYLSDKITQIETVAVSDVTGKQTAVEYNGQYVDLSDLSSGLYTIQVKTADQVYVGKLQIK